MVFRRILNNNTQKSIRKVLRKNQTLQEGLLWRVLRNRNLEGHKFFRQYSVGNFVLDFYCPEKKLAIEIDGGQHNKYEIVEQDVERTVRLSKEGIKVLRFWNNEIQNNLEGVVEVILNVLNGVRDHNSSQPPLY